jgi:hypothetical protein
MAAQQPELVRKLTANLRQRVPMLRESAAAGGQ